MTAPAKHGALANASYVVLCDEYLDQPFDAGTIRQLDIFQSREDAEFYIAQKDELTGGNLGFHAIPLALLRAAPALLMVAERAAELAMRVGDGKNEFSALASVVYSDARAAIARVRGDGDRV
jgi:hypothetical protein